MKRGGCKEKRERKKKREDNGRKLLIKNRKETKEGKTSFYKN